MFTSPVSSHKPIEYQRPHAPTGAKSPKHAPKRQNPRDIHAAKSAKGEHPRKRRVTLG